MRGAGYLFLIDLLLEHGQHLNQGEGVVELHAPVSAIERVEGKGATFDRELRDSLEMSGVGFGLLEVST
jgi:hypothetical protein